jgi:hypothetical protein
MNSVFILQRQYGQDGSDIHSVYQTLEEAKKVAEDKNTKRPGCNYTTMFIEEYSLETNDVVNDLWQLEENGWIRYIDGHNKVLGVK